jgi:hypothetical protein
LNIGLQREGAIIEGIARPENISPITLICPGCSSSAGPNLRCVLTRRLLDEATHQEVFGWVLRRVTRAGLLKGKTIGIDATTLEANAAMKSIVRRDTEESYTEYLKHLAEAAGVEASDEAALRRMDRRRKKKGSNAEWVNPHDPQAEITRMKDGGTALAYKAEHAVDTDTGAIVTVTTHGGALGDTTSVEETLPAAGEAIVEQIAEPTADGKFTVNAKGFEELVADKGYHSADVLVSAREAEVRTYIASVAALAVPLFRYLQKQFVGNLGAIHTQQNNRAHAGCPEFIENGTDVELDRVLGNSQA